MVNNKNLGLSTKAFILEKFRNGGGRFISGETLGEDLRISRVAVWKAVRSLQDAGYSIEGDGRGYRFIETGKDDFLYPWEFGKKEGFFRYWETTDSTMNRARELACRGSPGGTVITAETQTKGRGRNGRRWISKTGGLFFTLLERPGLPVADYTQLTLAVHTALGKAVSLICGKRALLRWPNDIYTEDKKIAGFLTELSGEGDRIRWITLGIGININNTPASAGAANCAEFLGHPVSRREALLIVLQEIEKAQKTGDTPGERQRLWNRDAEGIGRRVVVLDTDWKKTQIITGGIFRGIDISGRCLVQTDSGFKHFYPGTVSLRFKPI